MAGPTGRKLADALERHGLPVRPQTVAAGPRGPGDKILSACQTLGANLLVANFLVEGAYTQSRMRQMIFGGAISHVLATATIPVLLAQ